MFVCLFVFSFLLSGVESVRPVIGHCSFANTFNPLTAKSDQHLISFYNIPPGSNIDMHLSLFLLKVSCLNGVLSLELLFGERWFIKFTTHCVCFSGFSKVLTFGEACVMHRCQGWGHKNKGKDHQISSCLALSRICILSFRC